MVLIIPRLRTVRPSIKGVEAIDKPESGEGHRESQMRGERVLEGMGVNQQSTQRGESVWFLRDS